MEGCPDALFRQDFRQESTSTVLVMTTYRAPAPRTDETWEPVPAFSPNNMAHLVATLLEAERQQRAAAQLVDVATKGAAADDKECRESL